MRCIAAVLTSILCLPFNSSAVTFAQLALGGGYECTLIVTNQNPSAWQGVATLFSGTRQPWPGPWSIDGTRQLNVSYFPIQLKPRETRKYVLTGDATVRSGYLTLEGQPSFSTLNLAISYFYCYYDANGKLTISTGSPPSETDLQFVIPVEKSPSVDTGLAWVGGCPSCSAFWLKLYDSQGTQIADAWVPTNGHVAKFFTEIFDLKSRERFVGSILLDGRGSSPYVTVLRMDYSPSGFVLTSVPAAPFVEDIGIPEGVSANDIPMGRRLIIGGVALSNSKTVFEGELRAKFVEKNVTSVDLDSDYDFDLILPANFGGSQWHYDAKIAGRLFHKWRLQNRHGWSTWSVVSYIDTEY